MQILTPHFGLAKSETLQGGPGICRLSSSPGPSMQKKKRKVFQAGHSYTAAKVAGLIPLEATQLSIKASNINRTFPSLNCTPTLPGVLEHILLKSTHIYTVHCLSSRSLLGEKSTSGLCCGASSSTKGLKFNTGAHHLDTSFQMLPGECPSLVFLLMFLW